MSTEPISNEQEQNKPDVQENQKEQFVHRKAYEEVTKDMHKYKSKAKEIEAMKNELEAQMKAIEEQKLKDQQKWQELYEREKQQREQAEIERNKDKSLYLRSVKLNALKAEIGSDIKDEYLSFADIDAIELKDDGTLSSESVLKVANDFRQNHPSLLPASSNSGITNMASPTGNTVQQGEKSLNELTYEEKAELLKQLKNK